MPADSGNLRARKVGTFQGRDVVECICQLNNGDNRDLLEWDYTKGMRRELWMWSHIGRCECHGTGWVCGYCMGCGWLSSKSGAILCPQCRATKIVKVMNEDTKRWVDAIEEIKSEWFVALITENSRAQRAQPPTQPQYNPAQAEREKINRERERRAWRSKENDRVISEEIYAEA